MKTPKTFLLLSIVAAVLILGVAYANIANVNFEINGTATATPNADNFKVAFTKVAVTEGNVQYSAEDQKATFTVIGLSKVGDTASFTLTLANESTDIDALITSINVTNDNTKYFAVSHNLNDLTVDAQGTAEVTITVTMNQTAVTEQVAHIGVTFAAQAVAV